MRKHNEGYVLPLVLVVMVILSLIAVGVMSVSLRNLQTQKADIERMKAQYEAQGEIEKVIAEINKELKVVALNANSITAQGARENVEAAIQNAVHTALGIESIAITWDTTEDTDSTCMFELETHTGTKSVICTIKYQDVVTIDSGIKVNPVDPIYLSYEIAAPNALQGGDAGV